MGHFHDDILAPGERTSIHAALVRRYCWFEHVGRIDRYRSYQSSGLELRDPYQPDRAAAAEPPGDPSRLVVCLRPIDSTNSTPTRGERQFRMAISSDDLPMKIGMDQSHGPAVGMAAELRRTHPGWSNSAVFVEVAHRLGSFASCDPIAPSVIRVWTRDSSQYNPETWPLLVDTDESIVETF